MADDDDCVDCCGYVAACLILLSIIIIPITFFSLSMVTKNPKIYVQDLYIPALNGTPSSDATFFFVDLKLHNAMHYNGLSYGDLNLTFFYGGNRSIPVADYAVAGFYQGKGKTAHKTAVVRARGMPWEDALDRISRGLTVDLAVDLAGTVKLRRCGIYLKRKPVALAAVVSLDGSGEELDQKAVRLR